MTHHPSHPEVPPHAPTRSIALVPLLRDPQLCCWARAGSDSADDDTTTTAGDAGGGSSELSLEGVELVSDGTLTVCSDMPYKPFEFEEDGETTGFDYDIVSAMGEQLGVTVESVTTPFDNIIPALAAGSCDSMIASAMTITDERPAEKVDFTEPYFDADQSLLVLKENEDEFATLEDLAGEDFGVQVETTGATYAEENKPRAPRSRSFSTGDEMFPALISGDIKAALQDLPVNAYRATTAPDQFVVTETFPTGEAVRLRRRQGLRPARPARRCARERSVRTAPTTTCTPSGSARPEALISDPTPTAGATAPRPSPRPRTRRIPARRAAQLRRWAVYVFTVVALVLIALNADSAKAPGDLLRPGDLQGPVPRDHHGRGEEHDHPRGAGVRRRDRARSRAGAHAPVVDPPLPLGGVGVHRVLPRHPGPADPDAGRLRAADRPGVPGQELLPFLGNYGTPAVGLSIVAGAYPRRTIRGGIEVVPKGQIEAARSLGMSHGRHAQHHHPAGVP